MTYDNLYLIKIFEKIKEFSFSSRSLENSEMNWNYTGTGKTKMSFIFLIEFLLKIVMSKIIILFLKTENYGVLMETASNFIILGMVFMRKFLNFYFLKINFY